MVSPKSPELARAQSVGAAPEVSEMAIDLDSTVIEVCGKAKHGAACGHTKAMGYHPLVAVRDDTAEMVRSGSSQSGNEHFAREAPAQVRRLAADATVTVRVDAGFFSHEPVGACEDHDARHSITVAQNPKAKAATAAIDEKSWKPIGFTRGGVAQVAETTITSPGYPASTAAEPQDMSPSRSIDGPAAPMRSTVWTPRSSYWLSASHKNSKKKS